MPVKPCGKLHRLFEAPEKQKLMSPVDNFVLRIRYRRKAEVL